MSALTPKTYTSISNVRENHAQFVIQLEKSVACLDSYEKNPKNGSTLIHQLASVGNQLAAAQQESETAS